VRLKFRSLHAFLLAYSLVSSRLSQLPAATWTASPHPVFTRTSTHHAQLSRAPTSPPRPSATFARFLPPLRHLPRLVSSSDALGLQSRPAQDPPLPPDFLLPLPPNSPSSLPPAPLPTFPPLYCYHVGSLEPCSTSCRSIPTHPPAPPLSPPLPLLLKPQDRRSRTFGSNTRDLTGQNDLARPITTLPGGQSPTPTRPHASGLEF